MSKIHKRVSEKRTGNTPNFILAGPFTKNVARNIAKKYCQKCCQKTCFWQHFWQLFFRCQKYCQKTCFWQYLRQRFFRVLVKQGCLWQIWGFCPQYPIISHCIYLRHEQVQKQQEYYRQEFGQKIFGNHIFYKF